MPLAGFEPTIPEGERPQTHILDYTATGIDPQKNIHLQNSIFRTPNNQPIVQYALQGGVSSLNILAPELFF